MSHFGSNEGAIGIAEKATRFVKNLLELSLTVLVRMHQIISRINGFIYVETKYDYKKAGSQCSSTRRHIQMVFVQQLMLRR
ncbi:MAG: GGGtGRT protein [Coprococcus sp.]